MTLSLLNHFDSFPFLDKSGNGHVISLAGGAQFKTDWSKFGTGSLWSDGTANSYAKLDGGAGFAFPGDFTVDFWIKVGRVGFFQNLYDPRASSASNAATDWALYIHTFNGGTADCVALFQNGADQIQHPTVLAANGIYHIAVARSGSTLRLWQDGVFGGKITESSSYTCVSDGPMLLGCPPDATVSPANCWMDELRVLKGEAAWTTDANFTPPTAPYDPPEVSAYNVKGVAYSEF